MTRSIVGCWWNGYSPYMSVQGYIVHEAEVMFMGRQCGYVVDGIAILFGAYCRFYKTSVNEDVLLYEGIDWEGGWDL